MDELINRFSFEHCSRSGARFDYEKGRWFNHEYLMRMPDEKLAGLFKPVLKANGVNPDDFTDEYIARAVGMVKGRVHFIDELWSQAKFFFTDPAEYNPKDIKKRWNNEMPEIMHQLSTVIAGLTDMTSASAEKVVLDWIAEKGYHLGNVMNAFRLCVVGECKGPHMFDITELMGKERTIGRIALGIEKIKNENA